MGDANFFFFWVFLIFSIWTQIVEFNNKILSQMHSYWRYGLWPLPTVWKYQDFFYMSLTNLIIVKEILSPGHLSFNHAFIFEFVDRFVCVCS